LKPRIKLGEARTPAGDLLELYEHDGHHEVIFEKRALMASRRHFSEQELARIVCEELPPKAKVMIGGLGIGYTLRRVLDFLPEGGRAIQVELMPELVEWNRGPLAAHAGEPLKDPRTKLVMGDICEVIPRYDSVLAAILLDVDNGPSPLVSSRNKWLYSRPGLRAIHRALIPGGAVCVWAADDEAHFVKTLESEGFRGERHITHARPNRKGGRHYLFVGRKPGSFPTE